MEDIANHHGPESCIAGGNRRGEALTGVHAGQPLSPVRPVGGADPLSRWGRQHHQERHREHLRDLPGSETLCMHGSAPDEKRESPPAPAEFLPLGRSVKGLNRRRACTLVGSRTEAYD
jgi:hypothetical protein